MSMKFNPNIMQIAHTAFTEIYIYIVKDFFSLNIILKKLKSKAF